MYIFLDESGDLGFNFDFKKTSKFFVITLLVCQSRQALNYIRSAAKQTLKRKLNNRTKRYKNEIKGNSTNLTIKKYFYNKLKFCDDIKIYSIILDKKLSAIKINKTNPHDIYIKMSYQIMKRINIEISPFFIHIIADRCKRGIEAAQFSVNLHSELKNIWHLTSKSKITIEQISSSKDFGLQAVDLFSYGIYRKYEFNDLTWYGFFENKIAIEIMI